jgi:hypothetical protein
MLTYNVNQVLNIHQLNSITGRKGEYDSGLYSQMTAMGDIMSIVIRGSKDQRDTC